LAGRPFVDHHCHSLVAGWQRVGGGPWPAWRRCFTEAIRPASLGTDVPDLLGYRHFLAALAALLGIGGGPGEDLEGRVVAGRDELAAADPGGYLRRLLDGAGVAALLVDTGFGDDVLDPAALEGAAGRPVHPVVRLETVAEQVLAAGGPPARSLARFADEVERQLAQALDGGAVAVKSVAAYRGGLRLADPGPAERGRAFAAMDRAGQAARFDDPVLEPFLVRRAAELAAARQVPLQFHTGFGDEDVDLPLADPSLLRPLLRDPRTQDCPVVLLHCYPFVGQAAYLAGTYPQVWMDLSLALPLAEPLAADLLREALGLCPVGKLLAASDGHSYPEMHWWGAAVWRRALDRVLADEVGAGGLDQAAAGAVAGRVLGGNAARLYRLEGLTPGPVSARPGAGRTPRR
jgi:predicted TIM-barrel fold metal-dependent hydrolase